MTAAVGKPLHRRPWNPGRGIFSETEAGQMQAGQKTSRPNAWRQQAGTPSATGPGH